MYADDDFQAINFGNCDDFSVRLNRETAPVRIRGTGQK